jgi:hypothetical protein
MSVHVNEFGKCGEFASCRCSEGRVSIVKVGDDDDCIGGFVIEYKLSVPMSTLPSQIAWVSWSMVISLQRLCCSQVVEAVRGPTGATWFDSCKVSLPWHFCIVISQD